LNIHFGINNERQDCEIGTVYVGGVLVGVESVNGRWASYTYMK
jgi:hypothetical protein